MIQDEATKVGIDAMIKSSNFEGSINSTSSKKKSNNSISENDDLAVTLATDLDNLQSAMTRLHHLLDLACTYVDKTISGEIPPNYVVGRMLSDAINAVPKINPSTFDKMFNDSMQV